MFIADHLSYVVSDRSIYKFRAAAAVLFLVCALKDYIYKEILPLSYMEDTYSYVGITNDTIYEYEDKCIINFFKDGHATFEENGRYFEGKYTYSYLKNNYTFIVNDDSVKGSTVYIIKRYDNYYIDDKTGHRSVIFITGGLYNNQLFLQGKW